MLDSHPNDPLLGAILVSDEELDALWAIRGGGAADGAGGESLRARGVLGEDGLADPYDVAFGPLLVPELVASAHDCGRVDDERRVYFLSGEAGAVLGTHPTGARFVTAFDRAHLPELLVRFLGLRAWPGPESADGFRLTPEGDTSPAGLLGLLLRLGNYAFLRVRTQGGEQSLAWLDGGDGALWRVEPGLDPADEGDATGPPEGVTVSATTGIALVRQVAAIVPAWA